MSQITEVAAGNASSDGARRDRRRRGKAFIILFIVLAVAAAGTVTYIRLYVSGYQATDDASVNGDQVVISPQILGQIAELAVNEGDRVRKGETLVRLDASAIEAQEHEAEAKVSLALQNKDLARIKLEQAKADYDRAEVQYESKVIPKEQYDRLKTAFAVAQSECDISSVQIKVAQAQMASIRSSLAHTLLASPIDGIVAKKWVMTGDIVQPTQPIYTLNDISSIWIEANFKETQIDDLALGDQATITVDALPGRIFKGRVEIIGNATASKFALISSNNESGNFTKVTQRVPVRISVDGLIGGDAPGSSLLRPGLSAEVRVRTAKE